MLDQYSRTQLLLGKDGMDRLHSARVAVFGIGGVGGFCVPNAQHASRQAVVLAKNLLAARRGEPLTDYYHETIGVVAGLGLWKGVANFKGKTTSLPTAKWKWLALMASL